MIDPVTDPIQVNPLQLSDPSPITTTQVEVPVILPEKLPVGDSKIKSFMKWVGWDLLSATTAAGGSLLLAWNDICLKHYMTKGLAKNLNNINYPIHLIRKTIVPNSPVLEMAVVGPIIEELLTRLLIQEYLLKRIPKTILGIFPSVDKGVIDSKIAKCSRIVFTSLIFALPHYTEKLPSNFETDEFKSCFVSNRVFLVFGMGLVLGALQETTGNVAYPILGHMLHNFIPAQIVKYLNIKL